MVALKIRHQQGTAILNTGVSYTLLNEAVWAWTDASDVRLDVVLAPQTGLRTEEVCAFASRTLNQADRNYPITKQEPLAGH